MNEVILSNSEVGCVSDGPADLLHYWLSDRGGVDGRQMVDACASLSRRYQTADEEARRWCFQLRRGLELAGHADRADGRWAINPPALLIFRKRGGVVCGYLTGARTRHLRRTLMDRFQFRVDAARPADGPARWRVEGAISKLREVCRTTGVVVAPERGRDVLAVLPPLVTALDGAMDTDPQFDPSAPNLLCLTINNRGRAVWTRERGDGPTYLKSADVRPARHYWNPGDGTAPRVLRTPAERSAARWAVIRGQCRLVYGPRRRLRLEGPVMPDGPELLVHRFLRSASGLPPLRHARGLTFRSIGPRRAAEVARVLTLPLPDGLPPHAGHGNRQ